MKISLKSKFSTYLFSFSLFVCSLPILNLLWGSLVLVLDKYHDLKGLFFYWYLLDLLIFNILIFLAYFLLLINQKKLKKIFQLNLACLSLWFIILVIIIVSIVGVVRNARLEFLYGSKANTYLGVIFNKTIVKRSFPQEDENCDERDAMQVCLSNKEKVAQESNFKNCAVASYLRVDSNTKSGPEKLCFSKQSTAGCFSCIYQCR